MVYLPVHTVCKQVMRSFGNTIVLKFFRHEQPDFRYRQTAAYRHCLVECRDFIRQTASTQQSDTRFFKNGKSVCSFQQS